MKKENFTLIFAFVKDTASDKTYMYIPFEPLTMYLLQLTIQEHKHYIVLQRFSWPDVLPGKGFLASPYANLDEAQIHASQLANKEGKLLEFYQEFGRIMAEIQSGDKKVIVPCIDIIK